jgi:hypothetical protein
VDKHTELRVLRYSDDEDLDRRHEGGKRQDLADKYSLLSLDTYEYLQREPCLVLVPSMSVPAASIGYDQSRTMVR